MLNTVTYNEAVTILREEGLIPADADRKAELGAVNDHFDLADPATSTWTPKLQMEATLAMHE